MKPILDASCGSKMFWFDKHNPNVEFCDNRTVPYHEYYPKRYIEIKPDTVCDFTALPFPVNGIWVRSEDGEDLRFVTEFEARYDCELNMELLLGNGWCLAGYKTPTAAIRQIDDIQASLGKVLQPHVYDLRERKVKEE